MRKKLLSLLLVLCMVLALAPAALAANGEEIGADDAVPADRDTEFFTDQPHSGLDWEDIEVTPVTAEDFEAALDEFETALDSLADFDTIYEKFQTVSKLYMTVRTNMNILNIQSSLDYTDTEVAELQQSYVDLYLDIFDPFIFAVQDFLKSTYRDFFVKAENLTEDDVDSYLAYEGMTEEQNELQSQISALQETYDLVAANAPVSVTVDGVEWDTESAYGAYASGAITEEQYFAIMEAYQDAHYAPLGELYMEVLDLNTKLAASYGYDNYGEFSYLEEYGRDYTAEEAQAFFDAVQEYYSPLFWDLNSLLQGSINLSFFRNPLDYTWMQMNDFTSDETLALIRPYLGQMSDELLEAYDYMLDHHLYDIQASDTKIAGGFTTNFQLYGSPFFFNNPYGYYADFSTILHEFGHFDNYYWHASGWNDGSCSVDVAEVHSQSMELLFLQFYDEIFGSAAEFMSENTVARILGDGIVSGSIMGELELFASTTPDVTLDQICDKYEELMVEYEYATEQEAHLARYDWLEVPHLTTSPMYYISYATSASGALTFWLDALTEGYDSATDDYLSFVAQSVYDPFLMQFEEAGMENPLSPDYIEDVTEAIREAFDIDARLDPDPIFKDVPLDDPNYPLIEAAYQMGAVSGDENGNYNPTAPTTRGEIVQAVYNILARFIPADETAAPAFSDVADKSYAAAANWAAQYGIINGMEENGEIVFNGEGEVTREMIATIVYRAAIVAGMDPTCTLANPYTDGDSISSWALDAVLWLTEIGILSPVDEAGNLHPEGQMNRLNLASYAYNLFFLLFA